MKLRTTFLWAMIVSLSLAALIGIAVLLLPEFGPTEEILASTALFSAFSLVALCCAIVLEKQRLVESSWKVSESGRKRKYYRLNSKGTTALQTERQNWTMMNTFLTKLWKETPCLT